MTAGARARTPIVGAPVEEFVKDVVGEAVEDVTEEGAEGTAEEIAEATAPLVVCRSSRRSGRGVVRGTLGSPITVPSL